MKIRSRRQVTFDESRSLGIRSHVIVLRIAKFRAYNTSMEERKMEWRPFFRDQKWRDELLNRVLAHLIAGSLLILIGIGLATRLG